mmetsp:Transcript_33043/g.64069  ORF Transcript_33043/g.64069 Transcript_33043/m.64069 type:complete len:106 (-) Transcript_33043:49-366(-)
MERRWAHSARKEGTEHLGRDGQRRHHGDIGSVWSGIMTISGWEEATPAAAEQKLHMSRLSPLLSRLHHIGFHAAVVAVAAAAATAALTALAAADGAFHSEIELEE